MKDNLPGGRGSWVWGGRVAGRRMSRPGAQKRGGGSTFVADSMRLSWGEYREKTEACATSCLGTDEERTRKGDCGGNGTKVSQRPGEPERQENALE